MIFTKWDQSSPFNDYINSQYPGFIAAGCGPVAVGQFIVYHNHPQWYYGVETEQLKRVHCWTNGQEFYGTDYGLQNVSIFLYGLGEYMNAKWDYQTGTQPSQAAKVIRELGYENVELLPYDLNSISSILYAANPVIVRGDNNGDSGHMWLIDGFGYRYIVPIPDGISLVHCNFGWGGTSDGWYRSGIFKTNGRYYTPPLYG
ncbi:MAG: C10 family peptidase [Rikenellaceae bacterium]|nr:C10 family peptidase [Rikenellaceae bacterium]